MNWDIHNIQPLSDLQKTALKHDYNNTLSNICKYSISVFLNFSTNFLLCISDFLQTMLGSKTNQIDKLRVTFKTIKINDDIPIIIVSDATAQ